MNNLIEESFVDKGTLLLSLDQLEQALDQLTDNIDNENQKKLTK